MCIRFVDSRLKFLEKWVKARDEGKKFRPSDAAISKYETSGDLTTTMNTDDLKKCLSNTMVQDKALKAGSHF